MRGLSVEKAEYRGWPELSRLELGGRVVSVGGRVAQPQEVVLCPARGAVCGQGEAQQLGAQAVSDARHAEEHRLFQHGSERLQPIRASKCRGESPLAMLRHERTVR